MKDADIKAVMINEVVPPNPQDDFYSKSPAPEYLKTVIPLFQSAGTSVTSIDDITRLGIYLTNAVKFPKNGYTVEKDLLEQSIPLLEKELERFPNVRVIMLMGDVAKKAFNVITKKQSGKNVIPSGSTYKIRHQEFYWRDIRVMPSYIMTGGNILIEKSKFTMASEDIAAMLKIIGYCC